MGLVHFPIELNSMAVGAFRASCAVMVRITNISYQNSLFAPRVPASGELQGSRGLKFEGLRVTLVISLVAITRISTLVRSLR